MTEKKDRYGGGAGAHRSGAAGAGKPGGAGARSAMGSSEDARPTSGSGSSGTSSGMSRPAGSAGTGLLPAVSLPKGGGALHGIGEKFTTNAATGTGALSVPIATSPGRGGTGPALQL